MKTQKAEIREIAGILTQQSVELKRTKVRMDIADVRLSMLTQKEIQKQRKEVETKLVLRGMWIKSQQTLATEESRNSTIDWIATQCRIPIDNIQKQHALPGRTHAAEWSLLTFQTKEQVATFKKLINTTNAQEMERKDKEHPCGTWPKIAKLKEAAYFGKNTKLNGTKWQERLLRHASNV